MSNENETKQTEDAISIVIKTGAIEGSGVHLIALERLRQIAMGWTPSHDARHKEGELANAAACYAITDDLRSFMDEDWGNDKWLHMWPFLLKEWKPTPDDRIKQLTKAGAMIAAEIDRLMAEEKNNSKNEQA